MDPRLSPLAETLRLDTRLFHNCLRDLTDEAARERATGTTNSVAFIAAHLVDSRHYILHTLGVELPSPLKGAEGGFNDIDQVTTYPTLAEIGTAWAAAGDAIATRLAAMTPAALDAPVDTTFFENKTPLGILTFMVQHEAYHLGQLGLLRKYAGLPAMAYD